MQRDWMQWIPCNLVKFILFECRGIHAAWLNAVYSMQYEEMEPYWMRGILCSMLEWSGFLQNNWMQWIFCSMAQSIPIECSGFHAASLNAEDSLHCCAMDPDCIQWRPRSEDKCILSECIGFYAAWHKISRLNAADSMQHDWMQWILCSIAKASRLNAVHCMKRHWMQSIPFIVVQWITIVCSGVHAVRPNASRLNAVDFIQHGPNIPIECRGFHAVWLNAVESMPRGPMHPDWMPWIPCSMIECSVFHAAWWNASWLNAVYTMQRG